MGRRGSPFPWNAEYEAKLFELVKAGNSAMKISAILSEMAGAPLSRSAVIGKAHRAGLALGGTSGPRIRPRAPLPPRTRPARKRAAEAPPETPPEAPPEPLPLKTEPGAGTTAALAIELLAPGDCRWPIGDPQDDTFRFCGAKRAGVSSYCAYHKHQSEKQ